MYADKYAEYRLLGGIIDDPTLVLKLKIDLFTEERRQLFSAMQQTYQTYGDISTEGIQKYYPYDLPQELEASRGAKVSAIIDKLVTLAQKRSLIDISNNINNLLSRQNVTTEEIAGVLSVPMFMQDEVSNIGHGIQQFIAGYREKKDGKYVFVSTGFDFLDMMLGGEWPRQGLTVVLGKAGGGKTALIGNSIIHMAKNNIPSLFFSLEMRQSQLVSRMCASIASIDSTKLRKAQLLEEEEEKLNVALEQLQQLPIYINDSPHTTVERMIYEIHRHKKEYGIRAVFVDYLQIVPAPDVDSNSLGSIIQQLRNAAVDNDVSIIVISQQNRVGDGLDSIFGSGRVGHIADVVMEIQLDDQADDVQRAATFRFVKNREGRLGDIAAIYLPKYLTYK